MNCVSDSRELSATMKLIKEARIQALSRRQTSPNGLANAAPAGAGI